MLYLIGLGLNERGITLEGMDALKKCSKIYLEGYTVDFPYSFGELEIVLGVKVKVLGRDKVESDFLIKQAKEKDIALLIYGSPLFATTHESLIIDAVKSKIKFKIIYSSSVFDAISISGLQLYKFGKIASMPDWKDKGKSESFMDIIKNNQSINAHSLILCDIGLDFERALEQLASASENKKIKLDKIIVCSSLGVANARIFYDTLKNLQKNDKKMKVNLPFCIIIPSELHFLEKEALEKFSS